MVREARALGLSVAELPARPSDLPAVLRFLRKRLQHCDLIHTHEFKGDLLTWVALQASGRPWMATDHHFYRDVISFAPLWDYVDRLALSRAAAVITPSRFQLHRLRRFVSPDRLHVVYNGIDVDEFIRDASIDRDRLRDQFGIEPHQPLVSIVARLARDKGHRTFLEAAASLLRQLPEMRFWIIGDGQLYSDLMCIHYQSRHRPCRPFSGLSPGCCFVHGC